MGELAGGKLGHEGLYNLELVGGKLKVTVGYDGAGLDAGVFVAVEPEYFIDKLAELIPGKVDDAVFAMLKGALKGM